MKQYPILTFKEITSDSTTVLNTLNDFANWQQWTQHINIRPFLFQKINTISFENEKGMPDYPILLYPKAKKRANSEWSWSMVSLGPKLNMEWEIYLLPTGFNQYTLINCITMTGAMALDNYNKYALGINHMLRLMNRDLNVYLQKEKKKKVSSKLQAYIYSNKINPNLKTKFSN